MPEEFNEAAPSAPAIPAETVRSEHVYRGQPDSRQSMDPAMKPSRFRPQYRQLSPNEKALHDAIKNKAVELEELFGQVPEGRYKALSLTALEEAVMWNIKQLTS